MDLVVYDDDERRYVPWMVSVAAVVLTAVLAAGLTYLLTRSGQDEQLGGVTAPQAATESGSPAPSSPPDDTPAPSPSAEPSPAAEVPSTAPSVPPPAAPAEGELASCRKALGQADTALERSSALQQALADQTRIMDELLAKRLTTDQALDRSLPVLTRGATDRESFADELAAYERSRGACPG